MCSTIVYEFENINQFTMKIENLKDFDVNT